MQAAIRASTPVDGHTPRGAARPVGPEYRPESRSYGPVHDHLQSVKEIARHAIHVMGARDLLDALRRKRGFQTQYMHGRDAAARFAEIYRSGAWVQETGQDSSSGTGST